MAERDPTHAVERAGSDQLGELAVDLTEAHRPLGFEEQETVDPRQAAVLPERQVQGGDVPESRRGRRDDAITGPVAPAPPGRCASLSRDDRVRATESPPTPF
ncbi:hypothetical protein [Amycolatopsis decaplanina]|uniref:hypothetical protein n=1 Tax=Amycolatopsis decaplanina TaxID=208441 RepID=UPI0013781F5B|nr:hypothetical protein [Amycolatopsis decaplanina]